MTIQEAKELKYGDHVTSTKYGFDSKGNPRRFKINGAPKTWKTRPTEIRIPWKYGLYDYGYFTEADLDSVHKD